MKRGGFQSPEARWRAVLFVVLITAALFSGCAHFHPKPLSADRNAEQLESRTLTNSGLRAFLEQNLRHPIQPWPVESWDFEMLTMAALYYQPDLDLARARWAVARGGETTAAQRPNPNLNITPGYDTTTAIPSPWFPLTFIDIPIETAGKRRYRRVQAARLSEAARLNLATIAWQIRSAIRSGLFDFSSASQRADLLQRQVGLQQQALTLLEQQVQAGAMAGSELLPFRLALTKTRLDQAEADRLRMEAQAKLAQAVGIPSRELEQANFSFGWLKQPLAIEDLISPKIRREALRSRPDILEALMQYSASEAALQLEIARQYPDIHVQPGYQYDQGDNKWTLGLVADLPILNQNQGPIAEAEARRREAAARFNGVQAKALAEIDLAVTQVQITQKNSAALRALAEDQAKRSAAVTAQFRAGAVEQVDLVNTQVESAAAELVQLDGQIKLQQALGALEDAVQRPVFEGDASALSPDAKWLNSEPRAAR